MGTRRSEKVKPGIVDPLFTDEELSAFDQALETDVSNVQQMLDSLSMEDANQLLQATEE